MPAFNDQSGREATARSLRIRGVGVLAALAAAAIVLSQLAAGNYQPTFELTVLADSIGEGLTPGAEVKFHGLTIGSVKDLKATGYHQQRLTLLLEPGQAKALRADTRAQFTSSNVFGTAAVELVSSDRGPALTPGRTLTIGRDAPSASITGFLRQGSKLSSVLDSPEVKHILTFLRKHADLIEPVARSTFNTATILANAQTRPLSQSLSVIASFVNGFNDLMPLAGLLNQLLDQLDFLAAPGGADKVNTIILQVGELLNFLAKTFQDNDHWLAPLATGLVNLAAPGAYSLGSLAPAYDRLSGLIDRTSAAFPVVDGAVRARVDVLLDAMPGLAAALPNPGSSSIGTTGGGR
jgi:ABC-type transporter Mla subunit MlaD